ncbi:hypothetical protein OEZ86_014623 [Tetradesmus obliquus]|nr:hypothetical protein OEZ86_014623 [Tetradesmus obliquus]
MPTSGTGALLGHGGRWERWQPPAAATAAAAAASKDQQPSKSSSSNNQQWQLLSSGQSMYAFQPGQDPSRGITVHVMEAADAAPVLMTECTTDCTTAVDVQGGGGGSSSSSADVMCSTNQFNVGDVWFLPHLPEADTNSSLGLLRLWAGNEHGFAMAPVRLPQQLLAAGGATDAADAAAAPWIANLYVKHPSLKPGVGRRWGWNVQYAPAQPQSTTTPATYPTAQSSSSSSSSSSSGWGLQHIHHTSLGMLLVDDVQEDMQPGGPKTLPPANNIKIEAGQTVLQLPNHNALIVLKQGTAREAVAAWQQQFLVPWEEQHGQLPPALTSFIAETSRVPDSTRLAAWILYLRKYSSSAFWRAWLALLPPLEALSAAGTWNKAELQQLELEHYKVHMSMNNNHVAAQVRAAFEFLSTNPRISPLGLADTERDVLWAMTVAQTRAAGLNSAGHDYTALRPLHDLINHSDDGSCIVATDSKGSSCQLPRLDLASQQAPS